MLALTSSDRGACHVALTSSDGGVHACWPQPHLIEVRAMWP